MSPPATWSLRPAEPADIETMAEVRAAALRPDLERLGRFDPHRVRQRMRDTFSPGHTSAITVGGTVSGSVTLRPGDDGWWLEHFYLAPELHGSGIGTAVLRTLLARTDADARTVRLIVLQGSAARRLYERHGFVLEHQDPIDVFMARHPRPATP
ncbi:GNAT family N-acetyltransferase [Kitasatospora sp. NBC_01539]|uniref:GNAT family N-acetyltransferase n=1 Tax=Kitasatospora sp. NBC_01539 TaxID=2903577 RepID=UPI00386013B2